MNYFMDPLDYVEGLARGKYLKVDFCSWCGIRPKIYSEIEPRLLYFAKWSPVAMARYYDIDHSMDHNQHMYFDRKGQYMGDITVTSHQEGWFPGDNDSNPDTMWDKNKFITDEEWHRIVRIIKTISNYCAPINKVLKGLMAEFAEDRNWETLKRPMNFINGLAKFGLLISCGSNDYDAEFVNRNDSFLKINFNRALKIIYKESSKDSALLNRIREDKYKPRFEISINWLTDNGYL